MCDLKVEDENYLETKIRQAEKNVSRFKQNTDILFTKK
jgi:hypothetical protein